MKKAYIIIIGTLSIIGFFFSCRQNPSDVVRPPSIDTTHHTDTIPHIDSSLICIDCDWQCTVDGVFYSGSVDTAMAERQNGDTMIICTGTSLNKRANIHIIYSINRTSFPATGFAPGSGSVFFDTTTTNNLISYINMGTPMFKCDSFNTKRLKTSFSATLTDGQGVTHQLTNGKMTCELGKGSGEPKTSTFQSGSINMNGYWNSASFKSNSLILEGTGYKSSGRERLKIIVQTGASIKPGDYYSEKQQCLLSVYFPSLYFVYICETDNHLKLTIDSVNGSIVKGHYTGSLYNGNSVNGSFVCRVKDYAPYPDSLNKWVYTDENIASFSSAIYGGNILGANKSFTGNKYQLTINGETDQAFSRFKLSISSNTPIDTGTYSTYLNVYPPANRDIDSLYLGSPLKTLLNIGYMGSPFRYYCHIDSINNSKVSGKFWNDPAGTQIFRLGKFRASF